MGHCDVIYCNLFSSAARRWTKEQRLILEMFAARHLCTGGDGSRICGQWYFWRDVLTFSEKKEVSRVRKIY